MTLPLRNGFIYNFEVDWGDGTTDFITSFDDPKRVHTYTTLGPNRIIKIRGVLESWFFNNLGDKEKITRVNNLGILGWLNLDRAFFGCTNLLEFNSNLTDTSFVTNMSSLFEQNGSLQTVTFSPGFNTSNVTNMSSMFEGTTVLTSLDLFNFDTSNVTDMSLMFRNTPILAILNISSFNTSNVTNMASMFQLASGLNGLDLTHFNTSSVTNMNSMFANTTNLDNLNVTSWDISAVTNSLDIFLSTSAGLLVTCDQGGAPGTGTFFGETCM